MAGVTAVPPPSSNPTPVSAPPPSATPTASTTATAAAPPPAIQDTLERSAQTQDPTVVANLAREAETALTAGLTKPLAKGLTNPEEAAVAAPTVVSNVDFSKMTQDQQYDYLQKLTQEQPSSATAWKTGDKELNLVGVRSLSGGTANAGEANQYNDTIYACRMNNGKKEVFAFDASVDAGTWDKNDPNYQKMSVADRHGNALGIAHMADGHYQDAFTRGAVSGSDLGLRQSGWVRAHIDANNDGVIADSEKVGNQGKGRLGGAELQFQFHPGYGDEVGQNSAGCQAIKGEQWSKFQDLLREAPQSQKTFGYTLVDSKNLKTVDEQMAYKPPEGLAAFAKLDPINWWNGVTASSGAQQWFGMNIGCQGRGLVNNDDANLYTAIKDTSTDGKVSGVQGDNGIGIVRTPYLPFQWFKW